MSAQARVKVWDPFVRLFHWSLVAAFFVAYFTEEDQLQPHVVAGYVVGALIVARLAWGIVGPRHARFTDFVRGPGRTFAYLGRMLRGRARRYLGHNPAGGAMIVTLLLALTATVVTGLVIYGADKGLGPLAPWLAGQEELGESLEEAHEFLANFTLFLVLLHIGGVVAGSFMHRENLVRSMVTGYKRAAEPAAGTSEAGGARRGSEQAG